jgi:pSer/pThr/pTyr-binding forkhead associated (FHA) protein
VIQLDVLSGRRAGTSVVARRFPFHVGRSPDSALLLEDDGVWDRHLAFNLHRGSAVVLNVQANALASVNGAPVQTASLRNGDLVEFGAVKLRFSLSAARQRTQSWRELALWVGLGLIFAVQVAIIYLLLE